MEEEQKQNPSRRLPSTLAFHERAAAGSPQRSGIVCCDLVEEHPERVTRPQGPVLPPSTRCTAGTGPRWASCSSLGRINAATQKKQPTNQTKPFHRCWGGQMTVSWRGTDLKQQVLKATFLFIYYFFKSRKKSLRSHFDLFSKGKASPHNPTR